MATDTEQKAEAKKSSPVATVAKPLVKLRDIRNELKLELVERGTEIDLVTIAFMARVHILMLGEPGVAKSMLIDGFLSHIENATIFKKLLNKDTEPAEIFGPIALSALKEDRFDRQTDGYLPTAHAAFVDEVFRSNSTNLNGMLQIINEGTFGVGNRVDPVNLWSMCGATNNLPTHDREDLAAFADRLGIRRMVQPVRTQDGIVDVLSGQLARNRGESIADSHTTITKEEMEQVQEAVTRVHVPERVKTKLAELWQKADTEGLRLSVRRLGEGVKGVQANALLNDRGEVKAEDLRILEHFLWNEPDEQSIAYNLCLDFAGSVGKAAARWRTAFEEEAQKLSDIQGKMPVDGSITDELAAQLAKTSRGLRKVEDSVESAIDTARDEGTDPAELESVLAEVQRTRESTRKLMGAV